MILRFILAVTILALIPRTLDAEPMEYIRSAKRILFLGDSNTHSGEYVSFVETALRACGINPLPEVINLGLPSETCSGLSEPDHPFPRPDVHERLDRALQKTNPDVVVACYGMNDGIYYPFSEDRFAAFQAGINKLIAKVQAGGAKLILLTPPAFDPLPMRKQGKLRPAGQGKYAWFGIYENYDTEVLKPYAEWIMARESAVTAVLDIRTPMNAYLEERRRTQPDFVMSGDGVHFNLDGHRIVAATILESWGLGKNAVGVDENKFNAVHKSQQVLHDAWLSHVGHKRPGVTAGLPLEEARLKARAISPYP